MEHKSNETKSFSFEKLNNHNYSTWAFRMKHFLMKEGIFNQLEKAGDLSEKETEADSKAFNYIALAVENNQLCYVIKCTTGREAWKKLRSVHIQTSLTAQIRIMRNLFMTRLSDDVTMQQHLQKVFDSFNQLSEAGFTFENNVSVAIVLSSLSADYEPLITALEAWDANKLTLEAVRSKLLDEYSRKDASNSDVTTESALKADQAKRVCSYCGKFGHSESYYRSKKQQLTGKKRNEGQAHLASVAFVAIERRIAERKRSELAVNTDNYPIASTSSAWQRQVVGNNQAFVSSENSRQRNRRCYHCNETGHESASCSQPKIKSVISKTDEINPKTQSAKMLRLSKMYQNVLLDPDNSFQNFILDSGCSSHMCCDKKLFSTFKSGFYGEVTIASGDTINAQGIGSIKVIVGNIDKPIEIILLNVLYIPNLHTNLLSIQKITQRGFSIVFTSTECLLKFNAEIYLIGKVENGLYRLNQPRHNCAAATENAVCVHDWHARMAHRHLGDVRRMGNVGINIKSCNCDNTCEPCIRGKMSRLSFPKIAEPKTHRLECIVSDLCGPMQTESSGRSKYFITFTDLFSGYTEVAFMQKKSDACSKIIEFIERTTTATKIVPTIFRSDRGTEFTNSRLQNYFSSKGIRFECTAPYTPQQNGVSERKNRTLVEAARTMLIESDLPKKFWAEAVNHAANTFNRIVKSEGTVTPFELFFNKKPSLEFRQFGCEVYVMTPDSQRRKLDNKAEKMRFVGFDYNQKLIECWHQMVL